MLRSLSRRAAPVPRKRRGLRLSWMTWMDGMAPTVIRGTNAAATMAALAAAMDSLEPRAHLRVALEAGVETIIRRGHRA